MISRRRCGEITTRRSRTARASRSRLSSHGAVGADGEHLGAVDVEQPLHEGERQRSVSAGSPVRPTERRAGWLAAVRVDRLEVAAEPLVGERAGQAGPLAAGMNAGLASSCVDPAGPGRRQELAQPVVVEQGWLLAATGLAGTAAAGAGAAAGCGRFVGPPRRGR